MLDERAVTLLVMRGHSASVKNRFRRDFFSTRSKFCVVITEGKGGVSIFQPYAPSPNKALKKDSAFRTS